MFFGVDSTSISNSHNNTKLSTGTWYHLVVTYNGSGGTFYVNGVADGSPSNMASIDGNDTVLRVGSESGGGTYWDGIISYVAIWNVVLTQAEVTLLSSSKVKTMPLQIRPSNLKLFLPLDDQPDGTSGDGDIFHDRSSNANNGTGGDGANNANLTAKAEDFFSYP
mgnify:FL=1